MQLQAILFDLDGTIAETEPIHLQCFNEAFAHYGLSFRWDFNTYRDLLDIAGGRERLQFFFNTLSEKERPADIADLSISLHRLKNELYGKRMNLGFRVRPGVLRLLDEARSTDILCGVTTTTSRENVDPLLRSSLSPDYESYFDFLLTGTEIVAKKPDPAIYIAARELLKERGRMHCIVIEDSHIGVQAASKAGLPALVTVNAFTAHHDFSGARAVLSDLGEPQRPARLISGPAPLLGYADLSYLDTLICQQR